MAPPCERYRLVVYETDCRST